MAKAKRAVVITGSIFHKFSLNVWLRSGGEVLYNRMTMEWENPNHGVLWDKRGLTVSDELELHVVPEGKLQDLRNRTVDKNAIPCIEIGRASCRERV